MVYYSGLIADDYGFTKLVFHCDIKEPVERQITQPVLFDRSALRTSFFYHFDMDSLGVLPGQHLEVYFEVWDNDGFHGPKSKRSETFSYYKPSLAALDSIAEQTENDIMERLANHSDDATKLKDEIDKMLKELASKKDLDWSDKEKIKDLLEKQKEMEEEWNKLQEEQETLEAELTDEKVLADYNLMNEKCMRINEIKELSNELFDEWAELSETLQ